MRSKSKMLDVAMIPGALARRLLPLAAAAVLVALAPVAALSFDEVEIAGKGVQKGAIIGISRDEIKLDQTGLQRSYPVNEVRGVTFEQEPPELKAAKRFIENQQIDMAMENLEKLKEEEMPSKAIQMELQFYRAYCNAQQALAGAGDVNAAYQLMARFLTEQGGANSHHYYEACEISGDLKAASGDYETAAKAYGILARAPFPDFVKRAQVLQGRSLMKQEKYDEALRLFEAAIAGPAGGSGAAEQQLFALLGKAACLGAKGQSGEGVKIAQKIIAEGNPSDAKLFARAYNALGACYRLADQPKDALIAYLHTDILFYGDGESHAEALHYLSKLWREVGRADRAEQARTVLRQRYPGSVYNRVD